MKYLLFLGDNYYPSGGWDDFVNYFDTLYDAINHIKTFDPDWKWAHVMYEGKIILRAFGKEIDFRNHKWEFETI